MKLGNSLEATPGTPGARVIHRRLDLWTRGENHHVHQLDSLEPVTRQESVDNTRGGHIGHRDKHVDI